MDVDPTLRGLRACTPERRKILHRHAFDLVSDLLTELTCAMDPDFGTLDDDERAEYLAMVAGELGAVMGRYVIGWLATDLPSVADWRKGRG